MAKKKPAEKKSDPAYEARKKRAAARESAMSSAGRDVGSVGFVKDPARRLRASRDFRYFCETYYQDRFTLQPWSDDHLEVLGLVEKVVLEGGLVAVAMPRGGGKTVIATTAAEWAALNGHREFTAIIGATLKLGKSILDAVRTNFETSALLLEDYPEVLTACRGLDRIANRCKGQLYRGQHTYIEWAADQIVLPDVSPHGWARRKDHAPFLRPDGRSLASGVVVRAAGLTGAVRGMTHTRPDGLTIRPSLVIPDDPQTDRSARSLNQCEIRESLLAGAVLKMAGPGVKVSAIMPCTVIRPSDVADNLLDRAKHPEWQGVRKRMLESFPERMDLWEKYREMRDDGLRCGDGGRAATEFYRANRAEMDRGARVSWELRHNPDELSAVQHALNRFLTDKKAFWAEDQNDPAKADEESSGELTADDIAAKLNRHRRGVVPRDMSKLTAFVDVQQKCTYWCVCAWGEGFTGAVVDYGTWPDQRRAYFTLNDVKQTLSAASPGASLEAAVYAALEATADLICGRAWPVDGGGELRVERLLPDANWGEMTDTVYLWARQSRHAALVTPAHGRYVGAASNPLNARPTVPGEKRGLNWRVPVASARAVRHVLFDANRWKSFAHERFATPMGGGGCLSLFGDRPEVHRMFAEQMVAEYRTTLQVKDVGRTADEWKQRPGKPDNHFFDCVVGCCVAASMQGVSLLGDSSGKPPAPKPRVSFAELQRRKRLGSQ